MNQESRGEETPRLSFFQFFCDRFLGCFQRSMGESSGNVPSDDQSASAGQRHDSMIQGLQDQEQSIMESENNVVPSDVPSSQNTPAVEDPDHAGTFPWWKELTSEKKVEKLTEDEIDERCESFRQFDTVEDYSDHYFVREERDYLKFKVAEPSKEWVLKIQHEWKLLKKNLPDTIFVRIYGQRMDLLRAAIIGPPGTPYHNGLFFFDCLFPSTYPNKPPLVDYISYGLSPNPNMYSDGTVCLSLLGTWVGEECENWNPRESTMLQVLLSIQALVLNSEPYFNEGTNEYFKNKQEGFKRSTHYNQDAFLISCRTMLYSIRNPPRNFEDLVAEHFRKRGRDILITCRAYMDGMKVGKEIGVNGPEVDRASASGSSTFKVELENIFQELLRVFAEIGADCRFFLSEGQPEASASTDDVASTSRVGG